MPKNNPPPTPVAIARQPRGEVIRGFDSSNSEAPQDTIQHENQEEHHIGVNTGPSTEARRKIHLKCFMSFIFLQTAYTMTCYLAGQGIAKAISGGNDTKVSHILISSASPSIAISLIFSCMSTELFAAKDEIATATKKILISAIKYLTLSAIFTSFIDYLIYRSLQESSPTAIAAATLGAIFKAVEASRAAIKISRKRVESQPHTNEKCDYRSMA
jgi:hypothetical protein